MQYTRNFDFTTGTTIIADQIDMEFNTIRNVLNGNISTDNISNSAITPEKMATDANPETRYAETHQDVVISGLTISPTSGWTNLQGTITSGISYIGGKRVLTSNISNHAFTASKDTYVDLDKNGTFYYVEVTLNAAIPAITANCIRLMKITTDATKITAATDLRPTNEPYYYWTVNSGQNHQFNTVGGWSYVENATEFGKFIAKRDGLLTIKMSGSLIDKSNSTTSELAVGISLYEDGVRVAIEHRLHSPLYVLNLQFSTPEIQLWYPITKGKTYHYRISASDSTTRTVVFRQWSTQHLIINK